MIDAQMAIYKMGKMSKRLLTSKINVNTLEDNSHRYHENPPHNHETPHQNSGYMCEEIPWKKTLKNPSPYL